MKKLLIALCLLITPFLYGQDINGAWTTVESDDKGYQVEHTLIFTESYFSEAILKNQVESFWEQKGAAIQ